MSREMAPPYTIRVCPRSLILTPQASNPLYILKCVMSSTSYYNYIRCPSISTVGNQEKHQGGRHLLQQQHTIPASVFAHVSLIPFPFILCISTSFKFWPRINLASSVHEFIPWWFMQWWKCRDVLMALSRMERRVEGGGVYIASTQNLTVTHNLPNSVGLNT